MKTNIVANHIHSLIYFVRGHRVMIDTDLAHLYGVSTKALNLAVRRNLIRFPDDFMFHLTTDETQNLRFQIETSSWGGRRYMPYAFTEQGVAMLSSVLKSRRAALVNIEIMRTFVKLRKIMTSQKELSKRLEGIEKIIKTHNTRFKNHSGKIREIFGAIRELMNETKRVRGFEPIN